MQNKTKKCISYCVFLQVQGKLWVVTHNSFLSPWKSWGSPLCWVPSFLQASCTSSEMTPLQLSFSHVQSACDPRKTINHLFPSEWTPRVQSHPNTTPPVTPASKEPLARLSPFKLLRTLVHLSLWPCWLHLRWGNSHSFPQTLITQGQFSLNISTFIHP